MKYSLRPKHKNPNFESKYEWKNYVWIWVSLLKIKGIYTKYQMHTTEYLAFGKDLLARLYLTVKVYITKLLGVYIIYNKSHALNEVILFGYLHFWGFLWPWKLTLNIELTLIIQFCFQDDLLKLCFLTRCLSIFTAVDEKKEEQKSTYQVFLKDVTEEKNLEIHKHSWLSMV